MPQASGPQRSWEGGSTSKGRRHWKQRSMKLGTGVLRRPLIERHRFQACRRRRLARQTPRQRPGSDVPMKVHEAIEVAFARGFKHLSGASFHQMDLIELTQQLLDFGASGKAHQIQHRVFPKSMSHRRHPGLHRHDVPKLKRAIEVRALRVWLRKSQPKVALHLSSRGHVFGRHPHPLVPAVDDRQAAMVRLPGGLAVASEH